MKLNVKIAWEGWPFITPFLVAAVTSSAFRIWPLAAVFSFFALAFCFFFRDPERKFLLDENLIVSPADGKIMDIQSHQDHPLFPSQVTVVSIFLSLFDVHFTRSPLSGVVKAVEHNPGNFFPAYKKEASTANTFRSILISGGKTHVLVKQIVGVATRRIKCYVSENERVTAGQKIGLMYFGSRVDIFVSQDVCLKITLNQRVKGGITPIAEVKR